LLHSIAWDKSLGIGFEPQPEVSQKEASQKLESHSPQKGNPYPDSVDPDFALG
jgi:hypothetical protein